MIYKLHYQGKSIQIDIPNPLTYDKLVNAVMVKMGLGSTSQDRLGLPPEQQQLLVNNIEVSSNTDLYSLKLPMYPIIVKKLSAIKVTIGKVSFSTRFYFGYKCSVLYKFIMDVCFEMLFY